MEKDSCAKFLDFIKTTNISFGNNDFYKTFDNFKNQNVLLSNDQLINKFYEYILNSIDVEETSGCFYPLKLKFNKHFESQFLLGLSCYKWRKQKEIFSFSKELATLLIKNAIEKEKEINTIEDEFLYSLPIETLSLLPFECFFVHTDLEEQGLFTMLVNKTKNYFDKQVEEGIEIFLFEGDTYAKFDRIFIPLKQQSFGEWFNSEVIRQKAMFNKDVDSDYITHSIVSSFMELRTHVLPLLLYIASENAEIKENRTQKTIYKKPVTVITDKYNEIRKWDVGETISRTIKMHKRENQKYERKAEVIFRKPNRTHIRSAHWHHFWTGPRDNPQKRKLVLRWLAPAYINAGLKSGQELVNELPTRITNYVV